MDKWNEGQFYKRSVCLDYMNCNMEKEVFIHYILGVFSEIAGDEHAERGQAIDFFHENGQVFLVTRMSMRIHKRPRCLERLVFTTWFRHAEGKVFYRDCDVRTPEGELLFSLTGTWMLFDLERRQVTGVENYKGKTSPECSLAADCPPCKKVVPQTESRSLGCREIRYTDIDCNCHVNNSVYSSIAADFLPAEYRGRALREYHINFNRETKLGETLELMGSETETGYIVQGYAGSVLHFGSEFVY